jgi:hypothetical protein
MFPTTYLTLGGYTFQGFGVPERINGGGAQRLVVHKMLGGARVIDALGPDDDAIHFQGRFRNADDLNAMGDAMRMDQMRRAGRPVLLTYWNQNIWVVISKFAFSFERFYEVPYQLELEVMQNAAQQNVQPDPTPAAAVSSDATLAQQTAGGSTATQAAVQPLQTGSLYPNGQANVNLSSGTPVTQDVANGVAVNLGPIASAGDIQPTTPGGITAGGDPATMASGLTTQAGTMTDAAAAQNTLPVVNRMQVNLGGGF